MARLLSQSLIRTSSSSYRALIHGNSPPLNFSSRILTNRHRSNKSGKAQLIELELDSEGDSEVLGIRKLEEVIRNIIVNRSAPDWLPFVPGASYWVPPPRRPQGLIDVLRKMPNKFSGNDADSHDSVRAWPSSAFYIEGTSSTRPVPVEMEVEVKIHSGMENVSQAEDEES